VTDNFLDPPLEDPPLEDTIHFLGPAERWWCLEWEMSHGSFVAREFAKHAILMCVEDGVVIPEGLRQCTIDWLYSTSGQLRPISRSKRDRDRAIWMRIKLGEPDREIDGTSREDAFKQLALTQGGDWSTYRNVFRRMEKSRPAAYFSQDFTKYPSILDAYPDDDEFSEERIQKISPFAVVGLFGSESVSASAGH